MKRLVLLLAVMTAAAGCRSDAGSATRLTIELPAQVTAGESFQVTLVALDAQGRVVRDFSGPAALHADSQAELPHHAAFDPSVQGRLSLPVKLFTSGTHHIFATAGDLKIVSGPIVVAAAAASTLSVVSGAGQTGKVGGVLAAPVVVQVRDGFGNPAGAGTPVVFEESSGGSANPAQATADAQGQAQAQVTLGPTAGPQQVVARLQTGAQVVAQESAVADVAVGIRAISGDGQVAAAGTTLAQPLVALVVDADGNPVAGASVLWTATGGAQPSPVQSTSDASGHVQTLVTLSTSPTNATISAVLGSVSAIFHAAPLGLSYSDPAFGNGKVRLELVGPGQSPGSLTLRLVAARPLSGFTVGFDLPLRGSAVALTDFTPGVALPPGASPVAAQAAIATTGPLAGQLVTGQSQKRAGTGAVPSDSAIAAGAVFYTLTLAPVAGASPGVIFDGTASSPGLQAGLLSLAGTEVVGTAGFAVGRLELH